MVSAPVVLSVYVLTIAIVPVVVVAHVSNLSFRVPVVWSTRALVALGWAIAVVTVSHVAIAINTVFFSAPVLIVVRIGRRNSSKKFVFVNLVVPLHSSNRPVVSLLSDKALHDLVPRE